MQGKENPYTCIEGALEESKQKRAQKMKVEKKGKGREVKPDKEKGEKIKKMR